MGEQLRTQYDAMDECAEWAAREHPLPWPATSKREPLPTQPFAPGVIERYEAKRGDIGLALILGTAAGVVSLVWWWLG